MFQHSKPDAAAEAAGDGGWRTSAQANRSRNRLEHPSAADPVTPCDCFGTAAALDGLNESVDISPAEIEPLAAHRVAAVRGFTDQHTPSTVKSPGEQPMLRKSAGLIEQNIRLNPLGKNSGELIQKLAPPKTAALLTAMPRGAPHHLKGSPTQRVDSQGAFGAEQLSGTVVGGPHRAVAVKQPWR